MTSPSLAAFATRVFDDLPCFDLQKYFFQSRYRKPVMQQMNGESVPGRSGGHSRHFDYETILEWYHVEKILHEFLEIVSVPLSKDDYWLNQSAVDINERHFFSSRHELYNNKFNNCRDDSEDEDDCERPFIPFTQRVFLHPSSEVVLFGDIHGSVHGILRDFSYLISIGYINNDYIIQKNICIIFLGDYVDRGFYGIETLYFMMRLKISNPDKVYMIRGNHEDFHLNSEYSGGQFVKELKSKFPNIRMDDIKRIFRIYDFMPVAIYLSNTPHSAKIKSKLQRWFNEDIKSQAYILLCHGGLEVGYDPLPFLNHQNPRIQFDRIIKIQRKDWWENVGRHQHYNIPSFISKRMANFVPISPTFPHSLGFMWADFLAFDDSTLACPEDDRPVILHHTIDPLFTFCHSFQNISISPGRGISFGKHPTEFILKSQRIAAIIRAHQHNNSPSTGNMLTRLRNGRGADKLWENVYTFLSASSVPLLEMLDDSFGILTINERNKATTKDSLSSWEIRHYYADVPVPTKVGLGHSAMMQCGLMAQATYRCECRRLDGSQCFTVSSYHDAHRTQCRSWGSAVHENEKRHIDTLRGSRRGQVLLRRQEKMNERNLSTNKDEL